MRIHSHFSQSSSDSDSPLDSVEPLDSWNCLLNPKDWLFDSVGGNIGFTELTIQF